MAGKPTLIYRIWEISSGRATNGCHKRVSGLFGEADETMQTLIAAQRKLVL
jgi:hypothetical protein